MKKQLIIITALVFLVFLTACPVSPPAIMGDEPLVWDGHFISDEVFDSGAWVDTYRADGSYEVVRKEWDSTTEAWVQSWGARGTYTYDSETFLMTRTATEHWGWGDSDDWVVLADFYAEQEDVTAWSIIDSFTVYITSNGMYAVYKAAAVADTWEYKWNYEHKETSGGIEEIYLDSSVKTYKITGTEFMLSQLNTTKFHDAEIAITTGEREKGGSVYRLAPTGVTWQKGNTVTFWYTELVNRDRRYDWEADAMGEWRDWTYNDIRSQTMIHMGDFILEVDADSTKNLF
ncbi:MAG: hypothetical protein JEZ04_05325 [Spirochaetales bacterium]|nr:hypothetical protein [Spirochaetales bacterium]